MKRYNLQNNIGKAKYVINYHDGIQTHNDGSPFFGIRIFNNKKDLNTCIKSMESQGYVYAQ